MTGAMIPDDISPAMLEFLAERHLATLTTLRADGSPHVVPVGFTYDTTIRVAKIITFEGSMKVRNARLGGRAAVSQVDGGRWITLEGSASVTDDPTEVRTAVEAYSRRYRTPQDRPDRVVLCIHVDRVLGRA